MSGAHDRPTAQELVEAVREFLERDVMPAVEGRVHFHTRVAVNVLSMVERELAEDTEVLDAEREAIAAVVGADPTTDHAALVSALATAIREGEAAPDARVVDVVRSSVERKLRVANPAYLRSGPDDGDEEQT